jgi:CheY-like chemotaxis protein
MPSPMTAAVPRRRNSASRSSGRPSDDDARPFGQPPGADARSRGRGAGDAPPEGPSPRERAALVLVVDDTQDSRELYGLYLSYRGFRVELAADGQVAVNAAITLQPDVIVMDLSMPTLDGVAATRHLKMDPGTRHIPIIMLTGYPFQAIQRGALEAGVDVFLTKPCLPEDLESHIRTVLEARPPS